MKIVILEDELYTAKSLIKLINRFIENANILKIIDSVEQAIDYFSKNLNIDLIFMDIQLSDGLSFDIFNSIEIDCPIIFTTSYNEYAIKAFEVNSIDYLLKPIDPDKLEKSIEKFKKQRDKFNTKQNLDDMLKMVSKSFQDNYKTRFLVKTNTGITSVTVANIAYFYIDNQMVFIKTVDNKRFSIDLKLDDIEKQVNPKDFFRLNRQCISNINSISKIHNYFNSTLKVELNPPIEYEIVVSRYTIKQFKEWLDK